MVPVGLAAVNPMTGDTVCEGIDVTADASPEARPDAANPPRYPFAWEPPMQMPEALKNVHGSSAMEATLPSGDTGRRRLTRYQDVRALFADKRAVAEHRPARLLARISKDNDLFMDLYIDPDPPKHTQVRSLVTKAFTARRIESLRPYVQEVADELLDNMVAAPGPPSSTRRSRSRCPSW